MQAAWPSGIAAHQGALRCVKLRTLKSRIQAAPSRIGEVQQVERITGRRLMERIARKRREQPLCRPCRERGVVRVWVHLDHIIPLHQGGPDTYENTEGLCAECHLAKSNAEASGRTGGEG